jgi:hypothetical protein
MEDLDFSGLEQIFRERFLQMMIRRGKIVPETADLIGSWEHSGFNLGWNRKLQADDRQGLQGLLSYMERAPVSLRRLTYRCDGRVHYQGTRLHPRLGVDHQLLSPVEFLATLVPHILLRYQISSRLYGVISTRTRRRLDWIEHPPTCKPPPQYGPAPQIHPPLPPATAAGPPPKTQTARPGRPEREDECVAPFVQERRRNWARLIRQTWLADPELCPSCGERMKVLAAISSPAQDDIIEKILKHINRWNPPWQAERRARGPPNRGVQPSPEIRRPDPPEFSGFSDRLPTDDDYAVDGYRRRRRSRRAGGPVPDDFSLEA